MSVLANYAIFRWTWGGIDFQLGTDHPYSDSQTGASLGASAAAGAGVGVRRAMLVFDRTGVKSGEDVAESHFDFLNITGGDPDDTWTSSDYSTLEGHLTTWINAIKSFLDDGQVLTEVRWYRHGPGVVSPSPAERVAAIGVAGTSSSAALPPQDCTTITFRNQVRRSWGRTYLPGLTTAALNTNGTLADSTIGGILTATQALVHNANGADFPLVVTSKHLSAVLNVDAISIDNVTDIQRRRRWDHATSGFVYNTP